MSIRYYADLHCHPTLYSFNRLRNTPAEADPAQFHAWNVPESNQSHQEAGTRATLYSQCDVHKLAAGKGRLMFASITPIETGFFQGSALPENHRPFGVEVLRLASGVTAITALKRLVTEGKQGALEELLSVLRNRGPLRQALQVVVMRHSLQRVRFMLSDKFDYWEELEREYDFLLSKDGVQAELSEAVTHAPDAPDYGRYDLIRNGKQLRKTLDADDGRIAMVLTIEGGHVFSMTPDDERISDQLIFERIEQMKMWPHPFLFLTIAHHFDNGFCGHARSLIDLLGMLMDQSPRLHEGFETENDLGRRVLRALLDIDEDLNDLGGRRILIDCKHLSPVARKEFYSEFVVPYGEKNKNRRGSKRTIPVIHSHSGYSGVATLDQFIADQDKQNDHWQLDGFNAWGINVCDEDVEMVHDSEGLIGVCFDQRIAGIAPSEQIPREHHGHVLARQILAMVDVIWLDDRRSLKDRQKVWDCICIGTDFDGVIDPVAGYPTALEMPMFAEDLRAILQERIHTRHIEKIGVDEIVDRILWKNAERFALKHLPKS